MNISEVVIPEFEAGLEMARKALEYLYIPAAKIQHYTESLRQDLFASFYSENEEYKILEQLNIAEHQYDIQWVLVKAGKFTRWQNDQRIRSQCRGRLLRCRCSSGRKIASKS
ncbi:MAG: hypothetical protein CM1200mP30_30270 [Pseudomonadota bacterium]|nr:MAG: hypothetical protein CM1200mP30_30270 [Pseudomonadota bacterium]